MLPESSPDRFKEQELESWQVPANLEGRVLETLQELRALLPADKEHKKVEELRGVRSFRVYIQKETRTGKYNKVAYGCPACKKIMTNPPEIHIEDSVSPLHPLSGRKGLDFYCTNCSTQMDQITMERS